ncbi:pentapeptide repeat-containing protein [Streptomyces kronopolitis]|uniref:pentapeptide repeat-containing protein n=1 Tax=Streptomyces kronopolitis TaxID=1612435 RepID=UPI0036BBE472
MAFSGIGCLGALADTFHRASGPETSRSATGDKNCLILYIVLEGMTLTGTAPTPALPDWPHCGHGEDPATDPVGCRGIQVPTYSVCLAHLNQSDRDAYLASLEPSDDIDHRGTAFTERLLSVLLSALTDPATGRPRIGKARFDQAEFNSSSTFDAVTFEGSACFGGATFDGNTRFDEAAFGEEAHFEGAYFAGHVSFEQVVFSGGAWFVGTEFDDNAVFGGAKFSSEASFLGAMFSSVAWFGGAEFAGDTWFRRTAFRSDASFLKATFERVTAMGPLVCTGTLDLAEAVFGAPVTIEAAARTVHCRRTRWQSTAALRLRCATVDLSDAVLEHPVSIAARSQPFTVDGEELTETALPSRRVRVTSLMGVDAAHLLLIDIDLSQCRFAGTIHLDQLRLEGLYTLSATPDGLRRRGIRPMRWTPRRTLIEEHHWRAARFPDTDGWIAPAEGEEVLKPAALAPVYRQLRKSFEDGKHEPGAADFYYGEMEMRRHADDIPWAERSLLTGYWALSGYGLRSSRAFVWLMAAMAVTVLAMVLWGLPQRDPKATSTGTLGGNGKITLTTVSPNASDLNVPYSERLSAERFEKSLQVVINSVVFRSSGQDLTASGTYIEMASRLSEPVLLGLGLLAIRNRVKR